MNAPFPPSSAPARWVLRMTISFMTMRQAICAPAAVSIGGHGWRALLDGAAHRPVRRDHFALHGAAADARPLYAADDARRRRLCGCVRLLDSTAEHRVGPLATLRGRGGRPLGRAAGGDGWRARLRERASPHDVFRPVAEIGRASCRERV